MTPDELKEVRRELGLSTAKLAKALGLGAHGGRTVRRWESGEYPIAGPVQVALELMLNVVREFKEDEKEMPGVAMLRMPGEIFLGVVIDGNLHKIAGAEGDYFYVDWGVVDLAKVSEKPEVRAIAMILGAAGHQNESGKSGKSGEPGMSDDQFHQSLISETEYGG
jgi:hypothetical protein